MPTIEITLNGSPLCRAGGDNCAFLTADVSGGEVGPVGLTVHGLVGHDPENLEHVFWINQALDLDDDVSFMLSDKSSADPCKKSIRIAPQVQQRSSLTLSVYINKKMVCVADSAGLEFVGASLKWAENSSTCDLSVHSAGNENDTQSKIWLTKELRVGDVVSLRVHWNSQPA